MGIDKIRLTNLDNAENTLLSAHLRVVHVEYIYINVGS